MLFLFHITEVYKKGVNLICLTETGEPRIIFKSYQPYFYCVNMPKAYRRDIKHSTWEESTELRPYIGFSEKDQKVIKM